MWKSFRFFHVSQLPSWNHVANKSYKYATPQMIIASDKPDWDELHVFLRNLKDWNYELHNLTYLEIGYLYHPVREVDRQLSHSCHHSHFPRLAF